MAAALLRDGTLRALLKVLKRDLTMQSLSQISFSLVFKTGHEKNFFTGRVIEGDCSKYV